MRAKTWTYAGILPISILILFAFSQGDVRVPATERSPDPMLEAAQAFVAQLNDGARAKALMSFDDEERYNWNFVPMDRKGLMLKDMTLEQRRTAHTLMLSVLSSRGYLKATSIINLETVLRELENNPIRRDPEKYYFAIFGTPSADSPWGWRLEGHHLSLNFSSVTGEVVVTTPAFMGTNPAEIRSGEKAGLRVLGAEEDLARALLSTLTEAQLNRTIFTDTAPYDIITGTDRQAILERFEGLPASEMTAAQRELLMRIVEEYAHNMRDDIAHARLEEIREAGVENLYFGWAGSVKRGEAHYYRIHGPTVLFEYDNVQDNANHIHAVWRDLKNDFGEDLLRQHYEQSARDPSHDHGHSHSHDHPHEH